MYMYSVNVEVVVTFHISCELGITSRLLASSYAGSALICVRLFVTCPCEGRADIRSIICSRNIGNNKSLPGGSRTFLNFTGEYPMSAHLRWRNNELYSRTVKSDSVGDHQHGVSQDGPVEG